MKAIKICEFDIFRVLIINADDTNEFLTNLQQDKSPLHIIVSIFKSSDLQQLPTIRVPITFWPQRSSSSDLIPDHKEENRTPDKMLDDIYHDIPSFPYLRRISRYKRGYNRRCICCCCQKGCIGHKYALCLWQKTMALMMYFKKQYWVVFILVVNLGLRK